MAIKECPIGNDKCLANHWEAGQSWGPNPALCAGRGFLRSQLALPGILQAIYRRLHGIPADDTDFDDQMASGFASQFDGCPHFDAQAVALALAEQGVSVEEIRHSDYLDQGFKDLFEGLDFEL